MRTEDSPHRIQSERNRGDTSQLSINPCKHRCRNKLECSHPCCKIHGPPHIGGASRVAPSTIISSPSPAPASPPPAQVPPDLSAELPAPLSVPSSPVSFSGPSHQVDHMAFDLLTKHDTIKGGKVTIRLTEDQWRDVETRAQQRCSELLSTPSDSITALRNAELLSAALAVSAYDVATEAHPTKGFLLRTSTGHARRRYRPLAAEKTVIELQRHLDTMKRSLRYTQGKSNRSQLQAQIKECRKLVKIKSEEASKQRHELDQRWAQERFSRNPWTAASETIEKPDAREVENTTYPNCERLKIESYFRESLSPHDSRFHLPPAEMLGPRATQPMRWEPISREEVSNALISKRNASSPGSDTVTNVLLKNCPALHERFATVFNDLLMHSVCPPAWKTAVTRLIHKKGATDDPKNWRPISLTSTLGKTFHSIIAHRLTRHLIEQNVIDPEIQKGFLPSINGTLEHTQTPSTLLQHYQKKLTSVLFISARFE